MYLFLKSFFDRCVSFISIFFLFPLFLFISFLIIIIDKEKPFLVRLGLSIKKENFTYLNLEL